jgi:hypothetical protein
MIRRLLIVYVTLLAVACSKKSGTPPPATDVPVNITATDSGFVIPDTLHSGLNHFVYENRGTQIHECMFIRLPEGMSPTDYIDQVKAGLSFPPGALDCAGPGLTSPGERVEVWVSLEEGNYITGCWVSKHMTTRPAASFVVRGAPKQTVQPPHDDVTIRMKDFQFEVVGVLKRGEQTIRYETTGPSMHEADIVRLEEGRAVDDVRAWFKNQEAGPLPGVVAGGCMDSHDLKRVTWVKRTFTPGRYVFWCDMPMVQNAPENDPAAHVTHADAGMFKEVTID